MNALSGSIEFFWAFGGYCVAPGEEVETARTRCARDHALAESWASSTGCTFSWEDEENPGEFLADCDLTEKDVSAVLCLVIRDADGKALDSLGGIMLGHDHAQNEVDRRNFEAEMALGVFYETFGKYGVDSGVLS